MHYLIAGRYRIALCSVIGLLLLAAASFFGWQRWFPVQVAKGWGVEVYLDDIPRVSALAFDAQESLYVSQEYKDKKGVIWRYASVGSRELVVSGLSKPDGLTSFAGGVAFSQENDAAPVSLFRDNKVEPLFPANDIEGLASDGQYLYAVEDRKKGGRLLKYDPASRNLTVLRDNLEEPEGVTICPDGSILYTEKEKGWVKKFQPGNQENDKIVVADLREPSFLMCNNEGLWITEDRTHLARLLLLDSNGNLETILSHLRSPQTILPLSPVRFLLAEQGRGRILSLTRSLYAKK